MIVRVRANDYCIRTECGNVIKRHTEIAVDNVALDCFDD